MDNNYLLRYLARKLETCLCHYKDKECLVVISDHIDLYHVYQVISEEISAFLLPKASPACPKLIQLEESFCFILVNHQKETFIIGPLQTSKLSHIKHRFPFPLLQQVSKEYVPYHHFDELIELATLLHNLHHKHKVSQVEVSSQNLELTNESIKGLMMHQIFHNRELQKHHNSYQQELRELKSIEEGDLEKLKQSWEEVYTGEIGRLAKDDLRNWKNLAIVVITIASRAAMRGGANPEICFSLSDHLIMAIEEMTSTEEITNHLRQAEVDYTMLVREYKSQRAKQGVSEGGDRFEHPFVTKSKTIITNNLHANSSLQDIAEAIPCSVSYLTSLFKKETGQTIQEHVRGEKIHYAEQLLIYTDKSLSDIASILAFTSQSYFGKVFKSQTKFTPNEYRQRFGRY